VRTQLFGAFYRKIYMCLCVIFVIIACFQVVVHLEQTINITIRSNNIISRHLLQSPENIDIGKLVVNYIFT